MMLIKSKYQNKQKFSTLIFSNSDHSPINFPLGKLVTKSRQTRPLKSAFLCFDFQIEFRLQISKEFLSIRPIVHSS
jgi:hypothetical protein